MEKDNSKEKAIISTLSGKLTALIGGGLAILNGAPSVAAKPVMPEFPNAVSAYAIKNSITRPLPSKLVLRQSGSEFKLIAQH
jgi:hypothetical protein